MIHQRRGALPRWGLALPFFGSQNLTSLLHLLPAPHSFLALDPGKEERERENDAEEQKSGEERRSQVTTYRNPLPLTYHSTTTSGIISGSSSNTYYPIATENAYLFSSGGGGFLAFHLITLFCNVHHIRVASIPRRSPRCIPSKPP